MVDCTSNLTIWKNLGKEAKTKKCGSEQAPHRGT